MALPSRASKGSPPGAFARPASQSWAYAVRVTNVRRKLQLLASQTSVRSSFGTSCAMHDSLVAMFLKAVIKPMDLAKLVGAVPLLLGPLGGLAPLASAIMPILSKIPLDAASARSGREIALNFEKSVEHRRKLLHRVMEAQVSRAKREERFAIEDDGRERRRSSRSRSRTASKRKPDTGGRAPSADRLRDDFETFSRAYDSALDYALEDSTDLAHAKKAVKHLDNEVQDRESGTRAARAFARLPRQAREEVKAKVMTSSVEAETALDTATLFSGVRQLMYALLAVYVAYKFSSNALELVQTHTPPQILSMFGLESEAQKAEALEQRTRKLREQERERQAQRLQGDIAERRYRDRIRDIQRGRETDRLISVWGTALGTLAANSAIQVALVAAISGIGMAFTSFAANMAMAGRNTRMRGGASSTVTDAQQSFRQGLDAVRQSNLERINREATTRSAQAASLHLTRHPDEGGSASKRVENAGRTSQGRLADAIEADPSFRPNAPPRGMR